MSKTTLEKIESVQEQIRQLENQKKKLVQQQKERERKARTKRLIERGAILESLIADAAALSNEQIKAFLEKSIQTDFARRMLANLNTASSEAAAEKQGAEQWRIGASTAQTGGMGAGQEAGS